MGLIEHLERMNRNINDINTEIMLNAEDIVKGKKKSYLSWVLIFMAMAVIMFFGSLLSRNIYIGLGLSLVYLIYILIRKHFIKKK